MELIIDYQYLSMSCRKSFSTEPTDFALKEFEVGQFCRSALAPATQSSPVDVFSEENVTRGAFDGTLGEYKRGAHGTLGECDDFPETHDTHGTHDTHETRQWCGIPAKFRECQVIQVMHKRQEKSETHRSSRSKSRT